MNRKFIIVIITLIVVIVAATILYIFYGSDVNKKTLSENNGQLVIDFNFKELNINLDGINYKTGSPFKKELASGKYELKIIKEYYSDYERKVIVEVNKITKIKADLKIQPKTEKALKKVITDYVKKHSAVEIKYEIENLKIENGTATALINPFSLEFTPAEVRLKKRNGDWAIYYFGSDY